MKELNLNTYKQSQPYFKIFDVLLKEQLINKEPFLIENDINPSSYRLARRTEQNIGHSIIDKLCQKFGYANVNEEIINELNIRLNEINYNVYYKVYETYEDDIKYIDKLLEKNYIIFPLLILMKLILIMNAGKTPFVLLEKIKDDYYNLKKYKEFFNEEFLELFLIVSISIEDFDPKDLLLKDYDNPSLYFVASSKCCLNDRYLEALNYAQICKTKLINDGNYKRLIYLNYNFMSCYFYFNNYEDAYNIAKKQLLTLKSFKVIEKEYNMTMKHYLACLLALKKYKEIIKEVEKIPEITFNHFIPYMIALYHEDLEEYEATLKDIVYEDPNMVDEYTILVSNLDVFIKTKNKKSLANIKHKIMHPLYDYLLKNKI